MKQALEQLNGDEAERLARWTRFQNATLKGGLATAHMFLRTLGEYAADRSPAKGGKVDRLAALQDWFQEGKETDR